MVLTRRALQIAFLFTLLCILFLSLAFSASPLRASTLPPGFSETTIATHLTLPTAIAFAPDGRIFVTEQKGAVRVIKNNWLLPTPFVNVTTDWSGERGLLGIALHPHFPTKPYVYVYYTVPGNPPHNRLSRFTANGDVAKEDSEEILVEFESLGAKIHNAGALDFGPDGKLYVAVGENDMPTTAQ
jgi:glucose/arabinose dehydrogenase